MNTLIQHEFPKSKASRLAGISSVNANQIFSKNAN
jgi:hypothetical protein